MPHFSWPITILALAAITAGLIFALAAAVPTTAPATASAPATRSADWKLVWSDDFDYTGLPDPKKWGYEVGYVRNNEAQYYTRARKENARVENGMLILECRKDNFPIPAGDPNTKGKKVAPYTAASLITLGKASWTYGRIEVQARLPEGKGVWPAIWMLGTDIAKVGWPACGETDIMEFVGHEPDKVHGTLHYKKDGKHQSAGKSLTVSKPWEGFHLYAIEWTPERIDFFYDGTKYHSVDLKSAEDKGDNAFHNPFYLLINFALGGGWGGKIDDTILPQQFLIKSVRIYQKPL